MTDTELAQFLFDEFAVRYTRGEQPDVGEYLERAGAEKVELGLMIDRYLQAVPAREPTDEEIVLLQARLANEPALLVLRQRLKIPRAAVVSALVEALGLDSKKTAKVARYYHELETGQLDSAGVSESVWQTLAAFLSVNVRSLASPSPGQHAMLEGVYLRRPAQEALEAQAPTPAEDERDEIDWLFTGW